MEEVVTVIGEYSYLIKIRAQGTHHLAIILNDEVGQVPDIAGTNSIAVIQVVKDEELIPQNLISTLSKIKQTQI